MTDSVREQVLQLIRDERARQLRQYGTNADLNLGFGTDDSSPWLSPYSFNDATVVERAFRRDYELYETIAGRPTWMHLIREEVAELFESLDREHTIAEAVQVAALCVSLVETLLNESTAAK